MSTTQDRSNRGNIFSAQNLSELMVLCLGNTKLRDSWDAIALLSHVSMIVIGFRLVGLGEDHNLESSSSEDKPRALPSEWNATETSHYAFRYAHTQSFMQYMLKISRLGSKAVVNGLAIEDDKVYSVDVASKDFISPSSLPFDLSAPSNDTSAASRSLQNVFISEGRITDLASMLKCQIIQRLAPSLQKEGYEDSAHAAGTNTSQPRRDLPDNRSDREDGAQQPPPHPSHNDPQPPFAQPRPYYDPLAVEPPRRPFPAGDFPPPGFEDEHEIGRNPRGDGMGRRPLNIGERDLYPPGLGPNDPFRMGPHGGIGGLGGGGGGMHPSFDDPMFGGHPHHNNPRVPEGARYDPVGPGDGPPQGRGGPRFPGGGGGMGGGRPPPPNPFGGYGSGDFL